MAVFRVRFLSIVVMLVSCLTTCQYASAQPMSVPGNGIASTTWDTSSLQLIESDGVTVTATQDGIGNTSLNAVIVSGGEMGTFSCFLMSEDQTKSIFVDGIVDADGEIAFDYTLADSSTNPRMFAMLGAGSSSAARGFWGDYWHYLTHPWDMDDDLETGFYVAVGTSAVAGTVAGGMVIAGVDDVLWGGAAASGAAAAGTTAIPEGTGMVGWVVGDEIVAISLPNTSHSVLGTQVGAVVDGVAVEGAYAFTVIKEGGENVVLGSQNFGGVLSVPTFVINLVKAAVH